jgi:hypothetical protein
MTTTIKKHYIYFVCRGTSTNDIINSVNTALKKKKESLPFKLWGSSNKTLNNNLLRKETNIKIDEFSPLEEIGIKEIYMAKDNDTIKNIDGERMKIYTSLELSSIESGLILSSIGKENRMIVKPLPYMSTKTNISKNNLRVFMELFGRLISNTTNSIKYWDIKRVNSFLNISNPVTIEWNNVLQNKNSLKSFSTAKFKELLPKDLLSDHNSINDLNNISLPIGVIVSNEDFIRSLIQNISTRNSKHYEIERGSVWKIELNFIFSFNSSGRIIKKDMKYTNFVKMYPVEQPKDGHYPLKFINPNTFQYDFNGMTYNLFNAKKMIPLNYLKGMNFIRLSNEKKLAVKKIIEIIEKLQSKKNSKNIINNSNSNSNNNNLVDNFKFD